MLSLWSQPGSDAPPERRGEEGDALSDTVQTVARSAPSQRVAARPVGKAFDFPPSLGGPTRLSQWATSAGWWARPGWALPVRGLAQMPPTWATLLWFPGPTRRDKASQHWAEGTDWLPFQGSEEP